MPTETISFLTSVGPTGLLLVGIWFLVQFIKDVQKGEWVPKYFFDDVKKQRDEALLLSRDATSTAKDAVEHVRTR